MWRAEQSMPYIVINQRYYRATEGSAMLVDHVSHLPELERSVESLIVYLRTSNKIGSMDRILVQHFRVTRCCTCPLRRRLSLR